MNQPMENQRAGVNGEEKNHQRNSMRPGRYRKTRDQKSSASRVEEKVL
jgi:hypothetical protein